MKILTAVLTAAVLMLAASSVWAADPSGVWTIEGRLDASMEVKCHDGACRCAFKSAYGKYDAVGYFRDNKLALVYNYSTPVASNAFGFLVYEMQGDHAMLKKTYDLNGKVVGSDKWVRK